MGSAISKRIKEYVSYKGMRISQLEQSCGLSNGYINQIKKSIGDEKLKVITKLYPDLNITWLLTGVGEMINGDLDNYIEGETIDSNLIESSVRQRIIFLLEQKKISINSLSKKIDMSQVTMNKQVNGTTAISAKTLLVLLDYFDDISAEWLLRGEGDMIKSSSRQGQSENTEELLKYIEQLEALNLSGDALLRDKYEVIERLEKEIVNLRAEVSLLKSKLEVKNAG